MTSHQTNPANPVDFPSIEIAILRVELERKSDAIQRLWKERDALRAQRDELLDALRYHQDQTRPIQRSIDAIAKATGGAA